MPFLSIVHLREIACSICGASLAVPGARSFIVDENGDPKNFASDDPPAEMVVVLLCPNGHPTELTVPNEVSAEETMTTPEEAPLAADAAVLSGSTEGGAPLP